MLKLLDVIKDLDKGSESFARRLAIKRGKKLTELYVPLETFAEKFSAVAVNHEVRKGVPNVDDYYRGLPWGRPLSPVEVASVVVEIATAPHWRYASGQVVRLAVHG